MIPTYVETSNWKVQWGRLVASRVDSGQTESLKQLAMRRFNGTFLTVVLKHCSDLWQV